MALEPNSRGFSPPDVLMGSRKGGASGTPTLKALVLDADNRAALEAVQSLARHKVLVDVAEETHCLTFSSKRIHEHFRQADAAQPQAFLQWLRELDEQAGYSLIIPSSERALRPFLLLAESDPLRQKAVLSSNASLQIALDKSLTLELAAELKIPVPESVLISLEDFIPRCSTFPVVLKPVSSQILAENRVKQVRPVIAYDDAERRGQLRSMLLDSAVLQQELVPGHGVGIEALYDKGRLVWSFCHERLHEGTGKNELGSGSTYRRSIQATPELLRDAKALLDKLQWHGLAMVEFKCSNDGRYWLMEINPRLWGSLALAIDAGVDFPYGLLGLATGETLPPQPDYKINYHTRVLLPDVIWIRNQFAYGHRASACVEALKLLRPLVGSESWDYFDWGDLSVTTSDIGSFVSEKLELVKRKVDTAKRSRSARALHRQNLRRFLASGKPIQKVLFLCYGNICRSPASELLMRRHHPQLSICSAGFYPTAGRGSTKQFLDAAREFSLDLSNWSSRRVSIDMVRDADIIFLHDMRNYDDFCREFSSYKNKALFLGMFLSPASLEIMDPYDFGFAETLQTLKQISAATNEIGRELTGRTSQTAEIRRAPAAGF
ncbi:MAG: ATP-grasp domain-containing protein [Candidatus Acidiferrales bacterium]|jgi:protein-tyrosine-phosphatase/predicted ATP-grasp superfamily ATP-dependent carboligase